MTREEILAILAEELPALLKPTTDKLLGDVTEFMNGVVSPLADKIETFAATPKEEPKDAVDTETTNEPTEDSTMSNDPLMARVKLLEQQLADAAAKQEAQEKDGQWLAQDGKTLTEAIEGFFKTPEGMHFLPSNHVNGAGVTEPQTPKTGDKLDLDAALAAAFL